MAQAYNSPLNLVDWLDDICVRFIVNLPREELESVQRIMFQIEEGHWYYEDFIRPLDPTLPSINLKQFCALIFHHCPLLSSFAHYHTVAYAEFSAYKTRVPVRGAIMLNQEMSQAVLVKGWKKGAKWSFPRGKINKDESDFDCAVREVYEETGYDLQAAGIATDEASSHHLEVTLREQQMRLYVFRGVPMDTHFEPLTRKEISKIGWYNINDLPGGKSKKYIGPEDVLRHNQFYMVTPFIGDLKRWIKQQRKKEKLLAGYMTSDATKVEDSGVGTDLEAMAPELAQRDAAEARHFDSLLSRLNKSRQPATLDINNEVHVQTDDLAAQLKKLLSVGGFSESTNPPDVPQAMPKQGASLLSLLNPASQATDPSLQNRQFAYSPEHIRSEQSYTTAASNHQQVVSAIHYGYASDNTHVPARSDILPQFMHPPSQGNTLNSSQPWQDVMQSANLNRPIPQPSFSSHTPSALHDNSAQQSQPIYTITQSPAALHHSQLPRAQGGKPNLTAHSLSLLNAFKGQQPPWNAVAPQPSSSHPPAFASTTPRVPSAAQNNASSLLQALNGQTQVVTSATTAGPSDSRSIQANTLLNLFQDASNARPAPTIGSTGRPAELAPPVAELAAGSPRGSSFPQIQSSHKQPLAINSAVPRERGPPSLTSATVSGPLNAPNFDNIVRNIPPIELGTTPQPSMTPVPVHSVSPGMPLEAPRAMHHSTILDRQNTPANATIINSQQKHTVAVSSALSTLPLSFDKRATMPTEQKTALMSLFGNQTVQAVKEATTRQQPLHSLAGVNFGQRRISSHDSPVSPLPARVMPNDMTGMPGHHSIHPAVPLKKISRVSSLADDSLPPTSAAKSPVTPGEQQNFLLQYLQNVVTNEGRS